MPSGVVPHCRSCLLVWCLTIGHACWRATSLYAMPAGPFCTATDILTSWVQRDGYKSSATLTEVPLHQNCLLIRNHSQICLLVQCNSIRHACRVHLLRYTCFIRASPSGKKSGMLQIHLICLQVRCGSHGYVKLISYQPGGHLENVKFWVMHQLHHWNVTRMMSVTQESVKSAFCMQIPVSG